MPGALLQADTCELVRRVVRHDSLKFCSQNRFWERKIRYQVSIQISPSKPKKKGHLSVTLFQMPVVVGAGFEPATFGL
jgi:hypothetical protein